LTVSASNFNVPAVRGGAGHPMAAMLHWPPLRLSAVADRVMPLDPYDWMGLPAAAGRWWAASVAQARWGCGPSRPGGGATSSEAVVASPTRAPCGRRRRGARGPAAAGRTRASARATRRAGTLWRIHAGRSTPVPPWLSWEGNGYPVCAGSG